MSKAYAHEAAASESRRSHRVELAVRTDSLAALRAAVDHGAHSIRLRWRARAETGDGHPEFQRAGLKKAVQYAREHGCNVSLELLPGCTTPESAQLLLARAFESGINEIALSSQALALYLRIHHPAVGLRLLVDDTLSSPRALALLRVRLGITRVTLPPVVSVALLAQLSRDKKMELEVQTAGAGSAVIAGVQRRPNNPAAPACDESCSDGTPACNDSAYLSVAPDPLVAVAQLPALTTAGASSVLIEMNGRSPARMAQMTSAWRCALDRLEQAKWRQCRWQGAPAQTDRVVRQGGQRR